MAKRQPGYGLNQPLQNIFPVPIVGQRAPASSDKRYEVGQLWVDQTTSQIYALASVSAGSATWSILGPGASDVDTITGDSGGALSPAAGNINIVGGTGISTSGSGSTLTINRTTGAAPMTDYVVDGSGGADYTTIQAAVNAANAAGGGQVFVRPGTYTEDLTLYDNIGLWGSSEQETIIVGTHTPPASGILNIFRVTLSDATAIFSSAAAGTTTIIIEDCSFAVTNGYTFDLANWTGAIAVFDIGSAGGTDDGFINNTGGATVFVAAATVGAGTGNSMNVSGTFLVEQADIACPVDMVTGTSATIVNSSFSQPITLSNDSAGEMYNSRIDGGAAAALTYSTSGDWTIAQCALESSNNPCVAGAGAGTLTYESLAFTNNSAISASLTTARAATVGGTARFLTFDTDVAAAGVTLGGTTLAADGTDANITVTVTPKGSGVVEVDSGGLTVSAGDIQNTAGDIIATRSSAGADVTLEATNSDNTSATSRAGVELATGGTSSGDPYVNWLISGGQTFTMGIDNSSTNDDFVLSDNATLGTNNRISIDGSSGDVSIPTTDFVVTRSGGSGTAVLASVINTDNANADSPAQLNITSGGTSGGDAFVKFGISGGQEYSVGVDNSSTNDDFVISDNSAPGTNDRLVIDGSTGDTSVSGNLILSAVAKQIQMNGGAATDFIGQATLVAGTITIANTNIAAGDRIFPTRSSINGSTALGVLITSQTPSTSFTITSVQPGTPASTETNDVSIVDYVIIREN